MSHKGLVCSFRGPIRCRSQGDPGCSNWWWNGSTKEQTRGSIIDCFFQFYDQNQSRHLCFIALIEWNQWALCQWFIPLGGSSQFYKECLRAILELKTLLMSLICITQDRQSSRIVHMMASSRLPLFSSKNKAEIREYLIRHCLVVSLLTTPISKTSKSHWS